MKRTWLFLFVLSFIFAACNNYDTHYSIVVPKGSDSLVTAAAKQLVKYWKKISGKDLQISTSPVHGKTAIYIGTVKNFPAFGKTFDTLRPDAFVISISDTAVYLIGHRPKAALYAVNTLLEERLGCMKFTPKEEFVPKMKQITLKSFYKVYNPSFDVRIVYMFGQYDKQFRDWYKLYYIPQMWGKGMYVHTFHKLIPPEKYFNKHPEYFSLVNGRRIPGGQLCLSNPEVIKLLIKNLGEKIAQDPKKKYWSVSQNDTYMPCECNHCRALYKKYGGSETTYSGAYVWMANQVAKAYPDKVISTLAYEFTRHAPKNIKPLPNVNIMLCDIEVNRAKPLIEQNSPGSFVSDLQDWTKLTHNIYLWDYVVQFRTYLCPFPNFPILQPNLQLFHRMGIPMVFEQGSGHYWSDLGELKQYLLAKLLWNVNANVDSLVHRFVNAYYGKAASYILKYYYTINREIQKVKDTAVLNIFGHPSDYVHTFLRPKLMNYYLALMDSAQNAVKDDSVYLRRVKRARLAVDFAWIDIALNNNFASMPAIVQTDSGRVINPKLLRLLNQMADYARTDSLIVVNEGKLTVARYKQYVLRVLKQMLKPNKLKSAKVSLLTKPSPKYPVGGAKALSDGLFGSLDFHHNWLGFHGDDMVMVADFGQPTQFSHVEMNWLKDEVSWIFLPKEVKIQVSEDGRTYRTVADTVVADAAKRDFHVRSVLFKFNFKPVKVRYLKIIAKSLKTCPKWHPGYGQPSWIFTDEVIVW